MCIGLILLALWMPPGLLRATEPLWEAQASTLTLSADSLDLCPSSHQVSASGNVRLLLGGIEATADALAADLDTGELILSGNVAITGQPGRLESESLWLAWRDGRMVILNGRLRLNLGKGRELFVNAARLVRDSDGAWELDSADITPCDCGKRISPSFRLRCRSVRIKPDQDITARRATVDIHNAPVFHFHEITLPLSPRRTGLLPPRLGYTDRNGARLNQEVFLVIDDASDLTLGLDAMTRRGIAPTLETRADNHTTHWFSKGFYLYDLRGNETDIATHRFTVQAREQWRPTPWLRQMADVSVLSDTYVGRDFGFTWRERERDFAATDLGIELTTADIYVTLQGSAEQRLFDPLRDDGWFFSSQGAPGLHRGPDLGLSLPGLSAFGGRLLFQADARVQGWWRTHDPDGTGNGEPENPKPLWVLHLEPTLRAPLVFTPGVEAEVWAGLVHASRFSPATDASAEQGGGPNLGARLALSAYRVFETSGGGRVTHTLNPFAQWDWSARSYGDLPQTGVSAPSDPSVPLVPSIHHVRFGLENVLAGGRDTRREWLHLSTWQRVLLDAPSRERASGWLDAGMIELDTQAPYIALRGALGVDWLRGAFQNAGLWTTLGPVAGWRLLSGWRYAEAGDARGSWWWQRRAETEPVLHQLVLAPGYSPLRWLHLSYRADVRLDEPCLLEQTGTVRVTGVCNCWGAELSVAHRPPERVPDFWFSLDLSQWVMGR